ncbi:hypothetical protein ASA1KI_21020 [Opitutales bacterium ASA1]|uniref:AAA family ATPase n=1 Tax=Congregicoccus parvus TaxID=3081749 RepID=UPI002B2D4820|nr:hypothetical protein ASA1KI_21020 [Opitutales bacterium ASA1]
MAPDILMAAEAEELRQLAQQIRDFQEARAFSDKELERRYPGIGSTKTYKRILAGDLAELNLERQVANYRTVVAFIEATRGAAAAGEEVYDDLWAAQQLRRAFLEVSTEGSNARVILVEGDTGMGKSKALERLIEKYGQRILPLQAWDAWEDSPMALLGAILDVLGDTNYPTAIVGRLKKVIGHLRARPLTLAIDEAHHLGPRQLNTLKGLINDTPASFVLLAMPTLWKRIERDAWQEVRQLTGNRLAERVHIRGLVESDVAKLLERRTGCKDRRAVQFLVQEADSTGAKNRGNLKFVARVCKRLAERHTDTAAPELEDIVAACKEEAAKR